MNSADLFEHCRFVLSRTSHPGNIGAAARAIKTMGFSRLALINPKLFPNHQATAMAAGSDDVLARAGVHATLAPALSGGTLVAGVTARRRDLSHARYTPREAAQILAQEAQPIMLFGNEESGLSNSELDHCQMLITIPANPAYSSLNLAAAVQIVAYELRLAALSFVAEPIIQNLKSEMAHTYAPYDEIERFYTHLEEILVHIGFLDPNDPRRLMQRMRRLFARTRLETQEVNILRGILTAIRKVD